MSRLWMPLYIGDFLADTMHLNCQETGGYIRLLMHAWQHDGFIPDDNDKMARIVRCHPPHWPRLRKTLEPFFDLTKTPGSWYSKRIGLELAKANEISNKRKESALQKHSKAHANDVQMHTQSQSQLPSKKEEPPSLRSDPPAKSRGARLPEGWTPSDEDIAWAESKLPTARVAEELHQFCDYWHSKPGAKATSLNWSRSWRVWIRRTVERLPSGSPPRAHGPPHAAPRTAKEQRTEDWHDALQQLREYAYRDEGSGGSGEPALRLLPPIRGE